MSNCRLILFLIPQVPIVRAICTCSAAAALAYPADIILTYLCKRTLRGVRRAVQGTAHVVAALSSAVADIRCATQVAAVRLAGDDAPALQLKGCSDWMSFDAIIMATPPSVSAALLRSGSSDGGGSSSSESCLWRVLQGFKCEGSQLVLHSDDSAMPADRSLWSSVNFSLVATTAASPSSAAASVAPSAYDAQACIWLNAAQQNSTPALLQQQQLFQTWNPVLPIAHDRILASSEFQRPLCSISSVQLLKPLWAAQGQGGVFVCGSYCMHSMPLLESAVTSAIEVAGRLGATLPWSCGPVCLSKDIDFKMKNCRLDFRLVQWPATSTTVAVAAAMMICTAVFLKMRR